MDFFTKISDVTLLFDSFSEESKNLFESFKNIGVAVNAVSIEDDGFMPDGIISPFGYFMGDYSKSDKVPGKPLFFNQIKIPKYWEITANNANGEIMDNNKERGKLFFHQIDNTRMVKIVDWYDEAKVVRVSEHYNKYGALFCKTLFNAKGAKTHRTFYSADGEEVVYENFVTNDYIVKWNGKDYIIHGKSEFLKFFFKCSGLDETHIVFNTLADSFFVSEALPRNGYTDVLFWNEPINGEIPGNMQYILDGHAGRAKKVYVQRHEAYEKLMELGASPELVKELGYVYSFERENNHSMNALIFTNSDNIEKLEEIIKEVPSIHFHIAAITEMSSKLMSKDLYENVSLYPGVKKSVIESLLEKCDIYLDINHETEIVDAVHRAFLNNQLIMAFDNTIHNRNYVSPTNIFAAEEYDALIMVLNAIADNPELIDMGLEQQLEFALAGDSDKYDMNSMF